MLTRIFPRAHARYVALPLLGSVVNDFATWMLQHGYRKSTLRVDLKIFPRLDGALRRRGAKRPSDITSEMLEACLIAFHRRGQAKIGIIRSLRRYLEVMAIVGPSVPAPGSPTSRLVAAYGDHLTKLRGLAHNTVRNHLRTATAFLDHLQHDAMPRRLQRIGAKDLEAFIRQTGKRLARGSLQHEAAQLRAFLRFLAGRSAVPAGLDAQIDTPRLYRFEKLPRALPWATVQRFLQSIDRTDALGLRDYAMFVLIATYGLRVSEIAGLTLDDVHWRARWIRVPSRKTSATLALPLTDAVAMALVDYLRKGRPRVARRELFLRARAPLTGLKSTAVTMAFHAQVERTGVEIPFFGAHCLRHSYAVHLLRQGTPLKTIGDLLHHRTAEATCVYLRLATEDLREVALPLPEAARARLEGART